jgi:transcriptional regulator CtsR
VPSQINYVIQTRFTPERGYVVESKRGGGGGIRITKVAVSRDNYVMHILHSIGDELSAQTAGIFVQNFVDYNLITPREGKIMSSALSDANFPKNLPHRDAIRAVMLKNMLVHLLK